MGGEVRERQHVRMELDAERLGQEAPAGPDPRHASGCAAASSARRDLSAAKAVSAGASVVAYDRLIEDPKALYITFDNVEVGRMEAREVFKAAPKGNYVIIKGNKADANADFLCGGHEEIIGAAVKSGDIKIVGETYTDNWDPTKAQTEMEQFLTASSNKVDAVLSENDGMAGGVVAALTAQGLAGKVPVSGQDGDLAALNRVALGTQTVDVWKDARLLGKTAGDAAAQLCKSPDVTKVTGVASFKTPGGNDVTSILLKPQPITKATSTSCSTPAGSPRTSCARA